MDFTPTVDQQAVIDLATQIVGDHASPDQLRAAERSDQPHDGALWAALAAADLVGISLPESTGGGGYGLVEASMVAEVVGRFVAPVPVVEVLAAARCLAFAGDEWVPVAIAGQIIVPALREGPDAQELAIPITRAESARDAWTVTGEKRLVSGATAAAAYLVSAQTPDGLGLFVVDAAQVRSVTDSASTTGQILRSLHLDATPARRVALADPVAALASLRHELRVLRSAQLSGIAQGALQLAAQHCKEREQFGSPIGTFQAVAHRLADAWLDANLMQATSRQAAWRSDNDLPANQAAASAAIWACEGVQRVVHAAQHVHGGIGVDTDYPVHRYFRWAKDVELQLGGASVAIRDLGAAIASEPLTIG